MCTCRRPVGIVYLVFVGLLGGVMLATTVQGATGRASLAGPAAAAEPLDLLWISDSSGWGAASFYARRIRIDLGVDVRVEDRWEGDLSAAAILYRLRTPGHEWLPLIRNAEVIFVTGNPVGLVTPKGGDCVTSAKRPLEVGQRQWRRYIAGFRAIYRRIFQIRNGKPVLLRTGNWYTPAISHVPSHPSIPTSAGTRRESPTSA